MNPAAKATITVAGIALVATSAALVEFLGVWEGDDQLVVYADRLAGGIPTVCRGLTRHVTRTPIVVGERWTKAKCEAEESRALFAVQSQLAQCFRVVPPQEVFDMASSHAWNLGAAATCGSQAMVAWNQGDWALGCARLARSDGGQLVWSYVRTGRTLANGRPEMRFVRGLANRRAAEADVCANGWPQ